ncbi:putative 4-hydroxybenzoate polyprenyltransferase [Clostridium swellfunianum]|uniref:UbiA-like polyprenyltransferase n=1 Tax=Clostridium swellfunianum TaxID=1367462 RepID=UPI00202F0536|nr:UbiA-like polyprenyltransferase [Clostridium swellfunianum]MCM0649366.1 putative 4-hydroxybenzoate polyprenyltransferase [Clostridium swellfunianum]
MVLSKIKTYGNLVMFSHTIFSLPFAFVSMLIAANGMPSFRVFFWIAMAFLGARTGANAINRLIDKDIDAKNPRTANRHMPRGAVKIKEVIMLVVISFALLALSAFMLNPLCAALLPVAIFLFILYSYTKRFTWACHIVLGIISGGAPVGAWIAVTGKISWISLVLGAANALWVAGFDIIYGSQDVDFDRKEGLFSIPAVFGIENALIISSLFHAAAVTILIYIYFIAHMSWLFLIGIAIVSILLVIEHKMVSPTNLTNVNIASYGINQIVSIVFLVFSVADIFLMR